MARPATTARLLLTLLSLAAARLVPAAPTETPPVPLYTPALRTPLEVGGTGLAPAVTVRVTIDVRGRVTAVQVESIQPRSSYDPLFVKVTEETLRRWRYVPAERDGAPLETTLGWTIQFPSVEARNQEPDSLAWRGQADEAREDDVRQRLLALPDEQRLKLLDVRAGALRAALNPEQLQKFDSQRFMIFTDAPTAGLDRTLAANLEATFNTLHTLLGRQIGAQPEPYRVVVFMFASESSFSRAREQVPDWASGFYSPLGMLAFHMQMPSNESLLAVMLHETTHAYIDRYLAKPGIIFPRWLDEGFAEYMGNSKIEKGQLIPGKTIRSEVYRTPQMAVRGKARARLGVTEVKKAMRDGTALTIEELISANMQEFYGERRDLYYPISWLLVHFLRHGEAAWAEERFPRLMLYVAEGYPVREAFSLVYGEPAEHEQAFREYVKRF